MTSLSSTISDELKTFVKIFFKIDVESENDANEKSNIFDVKNDIEALIKLKTSMNVVSILTATTIT